MVAKIKSGKSLTGALNYNENKVKNGKAELIDAAGYFKDLEQLSFYDKLFRLTDLASGNERTKTNTVHISLNFANGEKLEKSKVQQIVNDYMEQIGFGGQPYLTYQHNDAGHPHVHIVTTNIQASGDRISLHLLGRTKSEAARKTIELKYGLKQAGSNKQIVLQHERLQLVPVVYGKAETKRTITNVVSEVIKSYKFTSIPEFNAILINYHIAADRGSKDSRMYEKRGLVYWLTNEKGNKLGVPIKASCIYGKPTLKMLEERFRLNEILRKPMKQQLIEAIDSALLHPTSKSKFTRNLSEQNVQVVFRQNDEGRIYGLTFVDHRSKAVFNGSDLGKLYSAAMVTGSFLNPNTTVGTARNSFNQQGSNKHSVHDNFQHLNHAANNDQSLLDTLFREEHQDLSAIGKLQQRKRIKKRKGYSL